MLAFHLGFNLSNPLDEDRIQTATEQKQLSHAVVSEGFLRTGLGLTPPTGCAQCGILQSPLLPGASCLGSQHVSSNCLLVLKYIFYSQGN